MDEAKILAATYFDRITVKRLEKVKNPVTGVTETKEVVIYTDIPCAIDKDKLTTVIVNDVGAIINTYTLFAEPKYKILAGDKLYVTLFNGDTAVYTAGKPFYYISHLECAIKEADRV